MLRYDKRFFELDKCVFNREKKTLHLYFFGLDNFEPEIVAHERGIIRQVGEYCDEEFEFEFDYTIFEKPVRTERETDETLAELTSFAESLQSAVRVDKTISVKNIEYLFGVGVKIRPIAIKYLRISSDLQVTAGYISNLKKRSYARRDPESGAEIKKDYWSFSLDYEGDRLNCVIFPTTKTRSKIEILTDEQFVAIIGVYEKRNDRTSFRVCGASYCENAKTSS